MAIWSYLPAATAPRTRERRYALRTSSRTSHRNVPGTFKKTAPECVSRIDWMPAIVSGLRVVRLAVSRVSYATPTGGRVYFDRNIAEGHSRMEASGR